MRTNQHLFFYSSADKNVKGLTGTGVEATVFFFLLLLRELTYCSVLYRRGGSLQV